MIKRSLLIIALAVVATAWMVQNDACLPDCNGKNPLDKVPDPLNCTNYYICLGDGIASDHAVPCPAGNYFPPDGPDCTAVTGTCEATCQPPDCHITCNGSFSLISDPFDCGKYYICIAGQVTQTRYCDPDTYFNGVNCVDDKEVCCTVSCVPYCQPGIVETPDPTDCTKYYMCDVEGAVDPNLHFSCKSGEHFDYQIGRCASGASCTNLCSGGSSTTTTGVTTTTTTSTDCVDSLTCVDEGNYPRCSYCQQEYFQCSGAGAQGVPHTCQENYVFNTVPIYPFCILPSNCPYYPPL
ncbi:peritrophin-48-like [Procambarus clarkii]|uniref:peritrophin-48-like n=1 Tax=Procambarus clarkii TaxID=6728 RepID=UPI003742E68A